MGLRDVDEKSIRGMTHTDDKGFQLGTSKVTPVAKFLLNF